MGRVGLAVPSRSHKHRQPEFDPQIDGQNIVLTLTLTLALTLTLILILILILTLNLTLTLTQTLTLTLTLTFAPGFDPGGHQWFKNISNRNLIPNTFPKLWSANKFSSYWLRTFSMSHARMQAEFIALWIGTCQKA